jgi:hypothetical protein
MTAWNCWRISLLHRQCGRRIVRDPSQRVEAESLYVPARLTKGAGHVNLAKIRKWN